MSGHVGQVLCLSLLWFGVFVDAAGISIVDGGRGFLQTASAVASSSSTGASGSSSSTSARAGPIAVPNGPTQLLVVKEDTQGGTSTFEMTAEARTLLNGLTGPTYIISQIGMSRLGKSTLLSLFVREWYEFSCDMRSSTTVRVARHVHRRIHARFRCNCYISIMALQE